MPRVRLNEQESRITPEKTRTALRKQLNTYQCTHTKVVFHGSCAFSTKKIGRAETPGGGTKLMWPWEHLAIAYVLFSIISRVAFRYPPTDASVFVLVIASQLPDLIDKPLSWGLGIFPSGYAIAHSIFFAVFVCVLSILFAWRWRQRMGGLAVTIGYLSHLLGDVIDPIRYGDGPDISRILWPLVEQEPYSEDLGLVRGITYIREFIRDLGAFDFSLIGLIFLLLPGFALLFWINDGTPGMRFLWSRSLKDP